MNTEVYLAPYGSDTYFLVDTTDELPMPHSRSIIDITSLEGGPGELMGGGSRTLKLPGNKNNNQVFAFVFEINIEGSFNTTKRSHVRIYQDKILILEGVLRLENITRTEDFIQFNCQITDGVSSLYTALGDARLQDLIIDGETLPYDSLEHTYDYSHISDSWSAAVGQGYVYPMIDYGLNDLHGWFVNQFYPAIYAKEYIDRIFEYCGYTYESDFFDTDLFKRLIIPCNNALLYTLEEVISRQFHVSLSASQMIPLGAGGIIEFDHDTDPDYDPAPEQFDTSTFQWTVRETGKYNLTVVLDITTAGTGFVIFGKTGGTIGGVSSYPISGTGAYTFTTPSVQLIAGDIVEVDLAVLSANVTINTGYLYNTVVNDGIAEGETLDVGGAVPQNIKAQDFFESIGKMFNLQVEVDPENARNLIIEPYVDFYTGSVVDWTRKWDTSKESKLIPMGLLNSKNYLFTYAPDTDYHNKLYSDRYYTLDHNDIYGERQKGTDNDYLTANKKTSVIFAPTPLALYNLGIFAPGGVPNTKVLSTIHFGTNSGNDPVNDNKARNSSVIRILYFAGLIDGEWQHSSSIGSPSWSTETQYPYAGHLDNPYNPTLDLCFGIPAQLFYQFTGQLYTTNGLYNAYYQQFLDEITDIDSKVVELYVKLNPVDMMNLSFRKLYLIDKTYYKLLEVIDFDFCTPQVTKVKLLKSTTKAPIATGQTGVGGGGEEGGEPLPVVEHRQPTSYLQVGAVKGLGGQENDISDLAINVMITGDGNIVYGTSKNVAIIGGSGNTVLGENVTLINCTGLEIEESNVVYINNTLMG